MNNESDITRELKLRLEKGVPWAKTVEELAATFGKLEPSDVGQLENEQLWKLWTSSKFAETGTPSLPTPNIEQWPSIREMTKLLCDRTRTLGERFDAARSVYQNSFTDKQVQLPVLLRTLLILEGGRYGTVATKSHLNPLLKWAGKDEVNYAEHSTITSALESVGELINKWANSISADSVGERASIPWHLCEMIEERSAEKNMLITTPNPDKLLSAVETAIKDTGFQHAHILVRRFLGALAAKPFIILTGSSGTGKTQLARLVSDWLSPKLELQNLDLFQPGAIIESDRIRYFVRNSDAHSVEFWNSEQQNEAIKVTLPREMISEWAATILAQNFTQETPARRIREAAVAQSRFSPQLHSFETHLKAAAVALLKAHSGSKCESVTVPARYVVIPVGADWTDNRNVLGFVNHLRATPGNPPEYESTPILELIIRALNDKDHPYFLILDEMNLSHVERYFADFLSAMESGRPIPLHTSATPLKSPQGTDIPRELVRLPDNLFITGTVNVDETTYMFSPKVLDRANVIEFRVTPDDAGAFLSGGAGGLADITPAPAGTDEAFLALARRARKKPVPDLALHTDPALTTKRDAIAAQLGVVFGIMHKHRMEFGYRTMNEVLRYAGVDYELAEDRANWSWEACLDVQILQKILPKLHGSKKRIERPLIDLALFCETGAIPAENANYDRVPRPASGAADKVKYRESYDKLAEMIEIVRRDQFVSFI